MPDIEVLQMMPAEHEPALTPDTWSTEVCDEALDTVTPNTNVVQCVSSPLGR